MLFAVAVILLLWVLNLRSEVRGFVKLKKIQKSRVGGWVKPKLGFFLFNFVFFVCFLCVVFSVSAVLSSELTTSFPL